VALIIEYLSHGSLSSILKNKDWIIEEDHIRKFSLHTCQGMTYLHSRHIIHRDLKCANLLVDKDWNVKVGDFGISRVFDKIDTDSTMTVCGTPAWTAPEVFGTRQYSNKADVYSFAVCLWEMTTRKIPYPKTHPQQIVYDVAFRNVRPNIKGEKIPKEFLSVMEFCWMRKPKDRPDFESLVKTFLIMTCPSSSESPYKSFISFGGKADSGTEFSLN